MGRERFSLDILSQRRLKSVQVPLQRASTSLDSGRCCPKAEILEGDFLSDFVLVFVFGNRLAAKTTKDYRASLE